MLFCSLNHLFLLSKRWKSLGAGCENIAGLWASRVDEDGSWLHGLEWPSGKGRAVASVFSAVDDIDPVWADVPVL